MINLPNTPKKGESLTFALNKSLVIAAVSDSYWSDSANISKCVIVYKSTIGHQKKRLEFDFTQTSPTVNVEWSTKARNNFKIEQIVLIDFDNDKYLIPSENLPSGKDLDFSLVVPAIHNYIPNGIINDMVASNNALYVAGAFTSFSYTAKNNGQQIGSGNYSRSGVAKFTKDASGNWKLDETFNPGSGGTVVNTLAISGNDLYVGGTFTTWNGSTRNRVAKLNATTGALDANFGVGVFTDGLSTGQFDGVTSTVYDIEISGTDVFIGGDFGTYSKKSSSGAATTPATPRWIKVNATTNTETVPALGLGAIVYQFIVDNNDLFLIGSLNGGIGHVAKVSISTTQGGGVSGGVNCVAAALQNSILYLLRSQGEGITALSAVNLAFLGYVRDINGLTIEGDWPSKMTSHSDGYIYISVQLSFAGVIRRINTTTNVLDNSWGYQDGGNLNNSATHAVVGNELIVAAGLSSLTPQNKMLFSLNRSNASQNDNI